MHKVACWAAERGDLQTVSLLMQNGGEDLNGSSRVMETAATHGHYDCLVALGVLRKKEALDWAFRAACRADQLDVVVELIQAPKEKRQYAVTQILLREGL